MFGPFRVASQPEEILTRAATNGATPTLHIVHGQAARQHGKVIHRPVGQDPGVQTGAAALHRDAGLRALGDARHATGQEPPAPFAIGDGIDPQQGRAGRQGALAPDRRAREGQAALHRPSIRIQLDRGLGGIEDLGGPAGLREGTAQQLALQAPLDIGPGRGLPAPPGRQGGHQQLLPQDVPRDAGQKALDRGRLQEGTAQGVGHDDMAGARGIHQTGDPQRRVRTQHQRVAPVVVHPPQHPMHGLQSLHGLEVEMLAAHGQVPALHQGQAQVARQVGLLEPGLAIGPRRQEHDAGRVTPGGLARGSLQRIQQPLVAAGDVLHPHLPKDVGKLRRDQEAVVQHIPQARRPLGTLGDNPPAAIGPASDIKGHDQQSLATRGPRPVHGAHIARMA